MPQRRRYLHYTRWMPCISPLLDPARITEYSVGRRDSGEKAGSFAEGLPEDTGRKRGTPKGERRREVDSCRRVEPPAPGPRVPGTAVDSGLPEGIGSCTIFLLPFPFSSHSSCSSLPLSSWSSRGLSSMPSRRQGFRDDPCSRSSCLQAWEAASIPLTVRQGGGSPGRDSLCGNEEHRGAWLEQGIRISRNTG